MKLLRAILTLAVGVSAMGLSTVPSQRVTATGAAIPAACITKARILPRTPGWVFALNFDTFGAERAPVACLMLYRVVYAPTDFVEVPCKAVGIGDDVIFRDGKATFNGGYIFCGVNIKERLAALTPPAIVPDVQAYPYFTIVAAGTLSNALHTDVRSNPIGVYRPSPDTEPTLGLYVPLLANARQVRSEFNGVANSVVDNLIAADTPYTFTVDHDGGPDVYTVTHFLNNSTMGTFAPRGSVTFYTNGGAFWVGASPGNLSLTFTGTLDEVIFDPIDGGRPPAVQRAQNLQFVPLAVKD